MRQVETAPEIIAYAAKLVAATDPAGPQALDATRRLVARGASLRAGQAMILGAKVLALVDGRSHAAREDVRHLAKPALRHRIMLSFEGHAEEAGADGIVQEIMEAVQ
jgi:MoxR-like ATPase